MISPIQAFDVSPIQAGIQAGMQRGAVNSPFTALGTALKGTLDTYHKNIAAQQEQQNKMDLITHEYGQKRAMYGAAGTDPDASGPFTQLDPKTGKMFYRNTTVDSNGIPKVSWAPVSPNAPEDEKKKFTNSIYRDINVDMEMNPSGQNPIEQGAGAMPVPTTAPQSQQYDPAKFKKQVNTKTGETRYVPR